MPGTCNFSVKAICLLSLFASLTLSPVFSQIPDATFGIGGVVTTAINDTSTANTIALQVDGKIIVAGSTIVGGKEYATLVRYNADGSLDNTFGAAGKVVSLLPDVRRINAITIQQDGKIVAGGISNNGSLINGDFTLLRYKIDGSIDSLFGNNGIDKVPMRGIGTIKKIIIKTDGKILAGGTLGLPTFDNIPALALLNTNGSVDSSFGVNGRFQDYVNNDTIRVTMISDMAFASDGKIVATGETQDYRRTFALFRYLANGILDSAFGQRGLAVTALYTTSYDAYSKSVTTTVQPDGKIVLAGYSYNYQAGSRFSLARYNTTGALDSTFGTAGKVIAQTGLANRLLTDPNGNLILTGYTPVNGNSDFAVAKYFSNGKTDSTFGTYGMITTDFAGFTDQSYAAAIQPDGKIILAGQAGSSSSKYSIALVRYRLTVLPLKLLTFTAQKEGKYNLLQWTTTNEINTDRFEAERSPNGKEYNTIGKTSSGAASYRFTDAAPLPGINYYRLKMIDKDGKFEYSPVRTISKTGSFYVYVYPLPATGTLNVQIASTKTGKATISITDVSGKILLTKSLSLAEGVNNTTINTQPLGKGVYFLKVVTAEGTETRRIIAN